MVGAGGVHQGVLDDRVLRTVPGEPEGAVVVDVAVRCAPCPAGADPVAGAAVRAW